MDLELLGRLASIIVIDLVLSGDNAVVIGMAARNLPPVQRRRAVIFGGGAAVGLRILFTAMAAILLGVPLLKAVGGVLLLWIAIKLLRGEDTTEENIREGRNLADAIRTIILADVVMSLDNILAVGAAAHGSLWLLLFGLALSIPILLVGSSLVARMMHRFPWLVWVGAGILAWTAGQMIVEDEVVHPYLEFLPAETYLIPALAVALVVLVALAVRKRVENRHKATVGHTEART